jgi:hypothetical protein
MFLKLHKIPVDNCRCNERARKRCAQRKRRQSIKNNTEKKIESDV